MAARERDGWLGDFSFVLSRDHFRSVRRDRQYEVFSGSKPLAFLWLVVVAAAGGALGGTLVSGALWGPWWQVPAWIAALVASGNRRRPADSRPFRPSRSASWRGGACSGAC